MKQAKPKISFTIAPSVLAATALAIATLTSGCGKSLEDLVRANRPKTDTATAFEGQVALKISPGSTVATGTDVAMTAHVTITDRSLTGSDVAAKVSLSRPRNDSSQ